MCYDIAVDHDIYHSNITIPITLPWAMGLLRQAALKNGEPTLCTSFAVALFFTRSAYIDNILYIYLESLTTFEV